MSDLVIISGGQTGVDRAAMDVALSHGIPIAGFCPKGRLAEDGIIPAKYPLTALESKNYADRTNANVKTADEIIVIMPHEADEGTRLTMELAAENGKPLHIIFLINNKDHNLEKLLNNPFRYPCRLMIAGPRESSEPGIYRQTYDLLNQFFTALTKRSRL